MKYVGRWWNNREIALVEISGNVYALNGWNGEEYADCWECKGEFLTDAGKEEYILTPVYEEEDGEYTIINYNVREK